MGTNMWICIRCTFENTDQVFKCQVCEAYKKRKRGKRGNTEIDEKCGKSGEKCLVPNSNNPESGVSLQPGSELGGDIESELHDLNTNNHSHSGGRDQHHLPKGLTRQEETKFNQNNLDDSREGENIECPRKTSDCNDQRHSLEYRKYVKIKKMIDFNGIVCEIKQFIPDSLVESLPEHINTPAKSSFELIRTSHRCPCCQFSTKSCINY